MHIRNWFTVTALLAIGAVSLPTPIPNGDLGAAVEGNHITGALNRESVRGAADKREFQVTADSKREEAITADKSYLGGEKREISEGNTYNGAGGGALKMRRATAQPVRLADSKREEAITADKSYEGAQWNGGGARERRDGDITGARADGSITSSEGITADKTYEGIGVKREESITAVKSYLGRDKREISADKTYEGIGVKREESITADKSYLGGEER